VHDAVLIINGGADDPLGLDAALHLIEEEDDQVTVAGNFKHLHAKIKAKKIIEKGGAVYDGNGCDEELMKYLIANVTGVVYLTSGRGGDDKASLDQRIYQYVEEHMKCFIGLLEILKDFKNIPLVYESYARNRVNDNQQDSLSLSIFTAVKKSMEDFAESYCQKYGVMAIGIRPMNHYSLSSDSLDKQSNEEHQLCKLYATYMRDVIDGIREAIEKPYLCGQVYELGGSKPVTIDTTNLLHNQNKFVLEQMELYQNGNSVGSIENITIDYKLRDRLKRKAIERKGELFIKRKRNIRMKYEEYAVKNDIHVARFYNNKIFKFYPNVDSGRDERKLNLPVRELKRICGRIDECVAFTSDGRMKSIIERKEKWKMVASGGLYIADIDVCQNGLHNCYGNSTCHYRGPGQFECRCGKGWSFTSQSPPTCQQRCHHPY
jgi:nucleoside-diphosphate-sugar epimerase